MNAVARIMRGPRPQSADPDTGEVRDATDDELLQRGLVHLATIGAEDYWSARPMTDEEAVGTGLMTVVKDRHMGRLTESRWERLPEALAGALPRHGWQ